MSNNSQPDTAEALLKNTRFQSSSGTSSLATDFSAQSVFANRDLSSLHPLAGAASGELDYLNLEDDALNNLDGTKGLLPSRG